MNQANIVINSRDRGGDAWCAGVEGDGPQLANVTGVACDIALAHKDAADAIVATGEHKGGASAADPVATAVDGVLPAGTCFQAGYIDSTVICNSIGSANASIIGQGQTGSCRYGVNADSA